MKKHMRYVLPAIALAILFSASAGEASAQVLPQVLKRMDAHNKALVSLTASIKMEKTDVVVKATDVSQGSLVYLPAPSQSKIRLRIDWTKPKEESLAIANGEYVL